MQCEYGCGQEATHVSKGSKRTGPFKGRPVHSCAKSSNSCPAVQSRKRQANIEKYGVANVMQIKEVAQKVADSIDYNARNKKLKKTVQERYGVDNVFQRQDIKDKIAATLPTQTSAALAKKKATRIRNGFEIPPEQKTDYAKYREAVDNVTRKHWREDRDKIENSHLERGRTAHHIDHIYSVYDGFCNNVEPEVVGHWCNLRLVPYQENCGKSTRSHITLTELKERYGSFRNR